MDHDFDMDDVANRTVMTPAERAVLVEQAENATANLKVFMTQCRDGTSGESIKSFIPVVRGLEYMNNVINHKIGEVLQKDHDEGRGH